MRSFVSRHLEYLLVLVLAGLAAAAVIVAGQSEDAAMPSPTTARTDPGAQRTPPTCDDAGLTPTSARTGTCRTASSTLTIVNEGDDLRVGAVRLRVRDAEALPAQTPSGRQRSRMRITLTVELENRGSEPYDVTARARGLYVVSLNQRTDADLNAAGEPGTFDLATPLDVGETRMGDLRFELSGAPTRAVERTGRAQLGVRVSDRRVGVVRLEFENLGAGG